MSKWGAYYQKTAGRKPHELFLEGLVFVTETGSALDIGAGVLSDSKHLLKEGFREVIAIDPAEEFPPLAEKVQDSHFHYERVAAENYLFLSERFDFVTSQFALPFLKPEVFPAVWQDIRQSLKQDSILCGQLFGNRDTWNTPESQMTFFTKEEVENLLENYTVLKFEEAENDSLPAIGPLKHWHIFNLILRKS